MRFILLTITLFTMHALLAPEDFIIPKKKRILTSALKENIGKSMGSILKTSADFTVKIGNMEQDLLEKMSELIEQDAQSFFSKASGQQLHMHAQVLENLEQVMQDCYQKINNAFSMMQASRNNNFKKNNS